MAEVENCYEFLKEFASDKVIYGINTGFGPMAQWRVDDAYLKDLQYNIIRSHSTGAGEPLSDICAKSAMIARLGTFLQCRSGVHPEVVKLLVEFINRDIIPFIPRHRARLRRGHSVLQGHRGSAALPAKQSPESQIIEYQIGRPARAANLNKGFSDRISRTAWSRRSCRFGRCMP